MLAPRCLQRNSDVELGLGSLGIMPPVVEPAVRGEEVVGDCGEGRGGVIRGVARFIEDGLRGLGGNGTTGLKGIKFA